MKMLLRSVLSTSLVLGSLVLIIGCSQTRNLHSDPITQGKASFDSYCTSCHGASATGDGPVAAALTIKPTDLTQLRNDNDGTFPTEMVYSAIDGREVMYSHGTREMPIWGNIWRENDGKPRPEEDVHEQISQIVEYLRSIQAPKVASNP